MKETILTNAKMVGIAPQYIKKVMYSFNEEDAFREPVDNAFNANPTEIRVSVTEDEIVWYDNGNGFDKNTLINFSQNMRCHEEIIRNFPSNSLHGIGLKDCLIRLSRPDNTSKVKIITSKSQHSPLLVYEADIVHNNNNEIFINQNIYTIENVDKFIGTKVILTKPIKLEKKVIDVVKNSFVFTYSLYDNVNIFLNGEEIITEDRCYMKNLGNVDYTDEPCVYIVNGIVYITKKSYVVKDDETIVPENITGIFLPVIGKDDTNPFQNIKTINDGPDQQNGGIYSVYQNRIIEHGEANVLPHIKKCTNGGGFGRQRVLHTMNNSPEVFGVSTNKSKHLKNYQDNPALYRKYDGQNSFFSDIEKVWKIVHSLYTNYEKNGIIISQKEAEQVVEKNFNTNCREKTINENKKHNKVKPIEKKFLEVTQKILPQTYDNIREVIIKENKTKNMNNIINSIIRENDVIYINTNSLEPLPLKLKENLVNQVIASYKLNTNKTFTAINKEILNQYKINHFIENNEINVKYEKEC